MLSVNRISANPHFTAQAVSQPQIQNKTQAQTTNQIETKPEDNKNDKTLSPKAKAAIGVGLTALASIGIAIATKGKGANPKIDIIEETTFYGRKLKTITDSKTGNIKEYIDYNKNGTESTHSWYDSNITTEHIDDALIKQIYYDEKGNISQKEIYGAPGKKSKEIFYLAPELAQKYGSNLSMGIKYYPNGKEKFTMYQTGDIGLAKMYDIDGNLIRERVFYTPKGLEKAKAENNVQNLTELYK